MIIVLFALLRPRLSPDRPGKLQHTFELIYDFLSEQANEQVGHDGHHYVAYFGTIFIFILFSNLIGVIPGLEAPTMVPSVPAGCAIATFFYYNIVGVQANGIVKYLAHFAGPMPLLAPLMIPIELVSHLARPLSLTIRLFANMYAGEQVTMVFLKLTFLLVPAVFMGLHVFVSFLQAYIFMLLTMMYVAGAVAHEH
jgi:F-type H+-transporting ATPase subunit a